MGGLENDDCNGMCCMYLSNACIYQLYKGIVGLKAVCLLDASVLVSARGQWQASGEMF